MNRITQKAKQNMRRVICEARIEGLKAQWPTTVHGAYIGGGTKIETDFFNL